MTDIIHAAPFFERTGKGHNFCLKEIVYNGDKHLNKTKQIFFPSLSSSFYLPSSLSFS